MLMALYLGSAVGIPVYMHYCGGELEQVSILVKSNSCCGEEEEDMDDGCCADENTFARFAPDFTAKKINTGIDFILPCVDFIFTSLFQNEFTVKEIDFSLAEFLFPPPKVLQNNIVRTSVIRI